MTDNEIKLLNYITSINHFNGDKLDFTKSWEEQDLESEFSYMTIAELNEYNKLLETNNAGSRAVLGSLVKKGLLSTGQDTEDKSVYWIYVDEEQFNKIKEIL